jgi:CheY-like chemotaxis protein
MTIAFTCDATSTYCSYPTNSTRAHEKGLELTTLVDPGLGTVLRGDPGRLRQILLNLVGNAVKFTESGEVAVRARMSGGNQPGSGTVEVCFEVADTGIGIPPEESGRLFDPFYQVDASASRHHGGTGLGLTISSRLVESMGGRIGVRSEPGRGSCFWFTARLGEAGPGRAPPPVRLDGLRVLVVDDSTASRDALLHQLAAWGADVEAAADVGQAVASLGPGEGAGTPYEVLIVDAQMRGLEGLGLLEALVRAGALDATRVILLTPPGSRVDPEVAARLQLAASLPKPVRQSTLLACLAGLTGTVARPAADGVPAPGEVPRRAAPVLVAEDNPVNQRVAVLMLRRLGYEVTVVGNGTEALETLRRGHYSAVLMDCQMPGMDGYEATGMLRAMERLHGGRRMPVIAMTAGAMEGDRQRCLDAGMDDYIAKPVNLASLEAVLRRWIGDEALDVVSLDRAAPESTA